MALFLAERLDGARHRRFVGRADERALFQTILAEPEWPFFVLYIFGPGGVGKTALLGEFVYLCDQAHTPVIYLDGRLVEPSPEALTTALQQALKLTPPRLPLPELAARSERWVILIDTYEMLAPLDGWLRTIFLPQLPQNVLMVLASSQPPPAAWRTDPGWQGFIRFLPLSNLSPTESRAYLADRAVPADQQPAILDFTQGHPLALALAADMFAQRDDVHFQPEDAPNMIQTLLARLVQKVPGPAHRTALEACAIVRVTTEAVLAEMLATPEAHELFEWLRGLSFIEARAEGLFPHDLVRDVLTTDLRWRNPDWYAELHRRARAYYGRHVLQCSGRAQQQVLFDYIFLHRHNAVVRPFFEWQISGHISAEPIQEADLPAVEALVAAHEGPESAALVPLWFRQPAAQGLVWWDAQRQPAGFMMMVALHQAGPKAIKTDPALGAAWRYLQGHAPLRTGEGATFFRFWLARSTYQAVSAIQSLIFVKTLQHYLTTPGLAYTFFPCAEPEFWGAMFAYADLSRLPEADFEVGGRRFAVFGHDWRVRPPAAWLELLAAREVALTDPALSAPPAAELLAVFNRPEFEAAVRQALRELLQPDLLRHNPLLHSRVVAERLVANNDGAERVAALQSLLQETVQALQSSPRRLKWYRALYHTYLFAAPTQEIAAELLDVPFSTFRRHLTAGIAQVIEQLWQQELGLQKLSKE